ncbi:MAG: hypothetical protein HY678_01550 [Chloroflexi bacterium]|nr:hypothetical protein [Chloroflexota bacterium]
MPVIINELEVIAAPPPPREEEAPAAAEAVGTTGPTVGDIESIIRRLVMRGLRVCAN